MTAIISMASSSFLKIWLGRSTQPWVCGLFTAPWTGFTTNNLQVVCLQMQSAYTTVAQNCVRVSEWSLPGTWVVP